MLADRNNARVLGHDVPAKGSVIVEMRAIEDCPCPSDCSHFAKYEHAPRCWATAAAAFAIRAVCVAMGDPGLIQDCPGRSDSFTLCKV